MSTQRVAAAVICALLIVIIVSGLWLWRRLVTTLAPQLPSTSTATATMPPGLTPTPLRAPPGYRLAGVAVGEPESFAVIEAPSGTHALYHLDADVPGLGKLVRIEAERVLVQSETGEFEMWLAPAATATATPVRSPLRRSPTGPAPAGRTPTMRTRAAPGATAPLATAPPAAGRAPGSTPSVSPGPPVS